MPDQAALARRYRRLLITYPRAYRKERGAEIVDTMLEGSPEGRTGPTFREAVNLTASGLRCRLGRPGSPFVVVLSLVTALMAGVVSAAVFSRMAWQTAAPLPSERAAQHIFDLAVPGADSTGSPYRDSFLFGYDGETSWWESVGRLTVLGGWDGYGPGVVTQSVNQKRVTDAHLYAASAAARLQAAGWQVSPDSYGCEGSLCSAVRFTEFNARKGNTVLAYGVTSGWLLPDEMFWVDAAGDQVRADVRLYRAQPALVVPAEIAGGLLGALLAWLTFGWVSRRTWRRGYLIQKRTHLLYCALTLLWTPPTVAALLVVLGVWAHGPRPMPNNWGLPVNELFMVLAFPGMGTTLLGATAAVLLVGVAALSRPRTVVETEEADLMS